MNRPPGPPRRRFDVGGWVVRRLGGDPVLELSLAGRTGWLDVAARDWWDDALTWSGATRELMPPLVAAGEPVGRVISEEVSPLLRGALLTLAGHDHQASAFGARASRAGLRAGLIGDGRGIGAHGVPSVPSRADAARLAAAGITTDPSIEPGHWTLLGRHRGRPCGTTVRSTCLACGAAQRRACGHAGRGRLADARAAGWSSVGWAPTR